MFSGKKVIKFNFYYETVQWRPLQSLVIYICFLGRKLLNLIFIMEQYNGGHCNLW